MIRLNAKSKGRSVVEYSQSMFREVLCNKQLSVRWNLIETALLNYGSISSSKLT